MRFPAFIILLAWLAFTAATPIERPVSSAVPPLIPCELWAALDASTSPSSPEATAVCFTPVSVATNPPASTHTSTVPVPELDSPSPTPPVSAAKSPLEDDMNLFPALLDDEGITGEKRGMPITHAVIGEIVGAFALFVVVNVLLICVWCPRRQAARAAAHDHSVPFSSHPRVTWTVGAGHPWRTQVRSSRSSTNTATSLLPLSRSSSQNHTTARGDDESTIAESPTSASPSGQDVQMPPTPPLAPPTPAYYSGFAPQATSGYHSAS